MIDVVHLLSGQTLQATLQQLGRLLQPEALVAIRCPVLEKQRVVGLSPLRQRIYRLMKTPVYLRTAEAINRVMAEQGQAPAHQGKGRWFVFKNRGS